MYLIIQGRNLWDKQKRRIIVLLKYTLFDKNQKIKKNKVRSMWGVGRRDNKSRKKKSSTPPNSTTSKWKWRIIPRIKQQNRNKRKKYWFYPGSYCNNNWYDNRAKNKHLPLNWLHSIETLRTFLSFFFNGD